MYIPIAMTSQLFVFSKAGRVKNPHFARFCVDGAIRRLPHNIVDTHKWVLL
jgi:hypothetical protein